MELVEFLKFEIGMTTGKIEGKGNLVFEGELGKNDFWEWILEKQVGNADCSNLVIEKMEAEIVRHFVNNKYCEWLAEVGLDFEKLSFYYPDIREICVLFVW